VPYAATQMMSFLQINGGGADLNADTSRHGLMSNDLSMQPIFGDGGEGRRDVGFDVGPYLKRFTNNVTACHGLTRKVPGVGT